MKFLKTKFPFRAAVLYTIVAGVWIILSDRLITRITVDPIKLTFLQTYKGWGFVIVTAGILYLFLRREWNKLQKEIRSRRQAEEELRKSKARLVAAQKVARMGDFTWDMETGDVTWSEGLYDLPRFLP